jgi:uncharacterized membrane protein
MTARAIDDNGDVVGSRQPAGSRTNYDLHGWIWESTGTLGELIHLPSNLLGIRQGWVLGYYVDSSAGSTGVTYVRWDLRSGEMRPTPTVLTYVAAINAHGWTAGHTRADDGMETAAIGGDGDQVLRLPSPPEAVVSPEGPSAATISDDGRVIGGAVAIDGNATRATRWTCS